MERTTQKDECGYYLVGDGIYSDWGAPEKFRGDDVDHLAAIEDILGDEYDLDELAEKVQANREGRCVVLPESYYTAEAAARKASAPAEQSERGQATAWIMQRFGQMS